MSIISQVLSWCEPTSLVQKSYHNKRISSVVLIIGAPVGEMC